jgi:hypothetical protein
MADYQNISRRSVEFSLRKADMVNDEYLSLYTGNHGKPDGIEDYIVLISKLMGDRGIRVKVSSTLDPHAANLVIDEFTNYVENHRIAVFRKANPDSQIVIVLTEFAERKWGVESFNHFGGVFDAVAIALFDVYLRVIRDDLGRVGVGTLLKLLCFLPLLTLQMVPDTVKFVFGRLIGRRIPHPVAKYLQAHHRAIYFHMRYLGLKACLRYANAVVASHEKIIDGFANDVGADGKPLRYFGVLYPELDESDVLDKLMVGKKLFIEITGSVTSYRQKWINRTNRRLISLGLHNVFGYCMSLPFSLLEADRPIDRGAYSLHPPQTRTWPYCSPTRIYRALSVDHNLPVLTHHFHQNPIEDVCLVLKDEKSIVALYEMYSDPALLRNFVEPRIKAYNGIAVARNNDLAEQVRAIMKSMEQAH